MPTYRYLCTTCNREFEVSQSISDEPLKSCPKELCQGPKPGRGKVKRLISGGAGLIFKGGGFYTTDYRSECYKQAAKKESEASAPKKDTPSGAGTEGKAGKPKPATS